MNDKAMPNQIPAFQNVELCSFSPLISTFLVSQYSHIRDHSIGTSNHVTIGGCLYVTNCAYIIDVENDIPVFVKVKNIISVDSDIIIHAKYLKSVAFNSTLFSFEVQPLNEDMFFKPGTKLFHVGSNLHNYKGKMYVRLRHRVAKYV